MNHNQDFYEYMAPLVAFVILPSQGERTEHYGARQLQSYRFIHVLAFNWHVSYI